MNVEKSYSNGSDRPNQFEAESENDHTPDLIRLYQTCHLELEVKTSMAFKAWGMDQIDQWTLDLTRGVIMFQIGDRLETFEMNVIGTYDTTKNTFMWGWEHPSLPDDMQEVAKMVQVYGVEHQIEELTTHIISCSVEDVWNYTALATHLAEADGAYSGEVNGTRVFVVFRYDKN